MNNHIESAPLVFNEAEKQFEIDINSNVAFIEYTIKDNKFFLTHTEVPKAIEGLGAGTALVEKTLQYIKDKNMLVVPSCSFVAHYIDKHPEWQSILSEGYQM